MKSPSIRQLSTGLFLSSSLLFSACTQSGAPALDGQDTDSMTRELTAVKRQHTDIGSNAGGVVATGYTCNAGDDITPTCGSNDKNLSYGWIAPVSGTYTLTTAGSSFDTVLQVNRVLRPGTSLGPVACNDDATGNTTTSSVTISANAGEEFLITVDGYGCGFFTLDISAPPCNTPPGQCHAGTGTWNRATQSCVYAPQAADTTCNDGDASTSSDSCDGAGACRGIPAACTASPPTIACGDFECGGPATAGQHFDILYRGNTSLSPWVIRGDGVDKMNGTYYVAQDGVVSLDMNARERGSVTQNIATVAGQKYVITFWVQWNTHPGPASLVVEAADTQRVYGLTTPFKSYPDVNWEKKTFEFTANASTTTLSFHSPVPGTIGARLDAVSIACGK